MDALYLCVFLCLTDRPTTLSKQEVLSFQTTDWLCDSSGEYNTSMEMTMDEGDLRDLKSKKVRFVDARRMMHLAQS